MVALFFIILIDGWCCVYGSCPMVCDQKSCTFGLLLCSEPGLHFLPEILSHGITSVIIINQKFPRPILTYKNLSRYGPEDVHLKQMTLQNCGLTDIESESFSHLIHLTHLDLSQNNLRSIRPRSFKALNLRILKLDGNPFLTLNKESLTGLVVASLSLANCGLKELLFDSIREISGHLTKLTLSGNQLKTISFKFVLLFRRLESLQLDNNPLKCDCHLRWLVSVFAKMPNPQHPLGVSATCFTPSELRGKPIATLPESLFECVMPSFRQISVDMVSTKSASLSCQSTENSDAKVYWHHNRMTNETEENINPMNRAYLDVERTANFDKYSCYAVNDNGNVTVDLNIQWPPTLYRPVIDRPSNISQDYPSRNIKYLFVRQFSLLEMILSVASTFVITIFLFSLIYVFLVRRIQFTKDTVSQSRCGFDGAVYSDIPIYDVPQISSPRRFYPSSPSSIQSTQLIDFKTQRLIPSTHH